MDEDKKAARDQQNANGSSSDAHYRNRSGVVVVEDDDDVLIDIKRVQAEMGGPDAEVSRATVYRAIARGRLSRPFHPSPGLSRWWLKKTRAEIRAAGGQ